MYIKRMIIENFQSHEYTEIEFPPGLTIIVGESDRGKSAIIRALRWVFENEPNGTNFIRAGARNCRVTVETDLGVLVIRERTPSRNRYILRYADGSEETFEGFRGEIPEEVIAAHGVNKVRLDNDLEVSLNIAPQLDGPFLLSSPGSVKAKAIGRLYKVHLIDAATRDTAQDINRLTKEEVQIDSQLTELDKKLVEFENLPQIEEYLKEAAAKMQILNQLTIRKNCLQQIQKQLLQIDNEKSNFNNIIKELSKLKDGIQLFENVERQENNKQTLIGIKRSLISTKDKLKSVRKIIDSTNGIDLGFSKHENLISIVNKKENLLDYHIKVGKINKNITMQLNIIKATTSVPGSLKNLQLLEDIVNVYRHLSSIKDKLYILNSDYKNANLIKIQTEKIELTVVQHELILRLIQRYEQLNNIKCVYSLLEKTIEREKAALVKTESISECIDNYNILIELGKRREELCKINGQHRKLLERIENGKEYLQDREKEILSSVSNYNLMLKKLGKCPTCFNEVDQATIERIVAELK